MQDSAVPGGRLTDQYAHLARGASRTNYHVACMVVGWETDRVWFP